MSDTPSSEEIILAFMKDQRELLAMKQGDENAKANFDAACKGDYIVQAIEFTIKYLETRNLE